jgi:hypothetical protein
MRFTVEYQPMITPPTQKLIRENVTPSMTSNDSEQYCLDDTIKELNRGVEIDATDMRELKRLQKEMVDYIEF